MCLLSVSVSYKLVSCCLIVIKRSIRVKLLPLAVPDLGPIYHFADDCFNVGHFPVSFPDAKASKGQSGLPCMLVKYYCISPGERVCSRSSLTARLQISHLSRKQLKELCFRCLPNSFWCSFSGWNPFWNEIQWSFFRINIYHFVKIWSKEVGVRALWSYSWGSSRFLGHFYSSSFHFESSLILPETEVPFCIQLFASVKSQPGARIMLSGMWTSLWPT